MRPGSFRAASADAGHAPLRVAFLYVPNGVHMPDWTPRSPQPAAASTCRRSSSRFAAVKDDVLVLSGLTLEPSAGAGRRRRRPRAGHGQLPDRPPPPQDRRRRPPGRASRSTSSPPRGSARRPGSPRWSSAARGAGTAANATMVIAAPISRTSRGGANPRPSPSRSTPAWSSIGSSAHRKADARRRPGPRRPPPQERPGLRRRGRPADRRDPWRGRPPQAGRVPRRASARSNASSTAPGRRVDVGGVAARRGRWASRPTIASISG